MTIYNKALFIAALFSMILSACAVGAGDVSTYTQAGAAVVGPPLLESGDVTNLFGGTASRIVSQAMQGKGEVWINAKNGFSVFARPLMNGYGFAVTSIDDLQKVATDQQVSGMFVSNSTWADFRQWLSLTGYQLVTATEAAAMYSGQAVGNFFPTFLVLPISESIYLEDYMEALESEEIQ